MPGHYKVNLTYNELPKQMRLFDQKIGPAFLQFVPPQPGIYKIYSCQSELIYVGKAKNLKRRLSQYRNAKRRKKHHKMRQIILDAHRIEFEICKSHLDALLKETQIIQLHRPKWNISGAFFFLYPFIGMRVSEEGITSFCYTTDPAFFREFQLHGAFRSRQRTRDAFFAVVRLLTYVCHLVPSRSHHQYHGTVPSKLPKFSYLYQFRLLSTDWYDLWSQFWSGTSRAVLETLILALVENAGARQKKSEIQAHLNVLHRFWKHEALPLLQARQYNQYQPYPVDQKDRDIIFLKFRA